MGLLGKLSSRNEKKEKDDISDDDAEDYLPPPPPYTDVEGQPIAPSTIKFPPMLNGYFQWKFTRTFHLGPSKAERLFAAEVHSGGITGTKPQIILRNGPTEKDDVLATSGYESWKCTKYTIQVPGSPGKAPLTVIIPAQTITRSHMTWAMPVVHRDGKVENERFEWRGSHGDEIKALGGRTWGWKLLRLDGPGSVPAGGTRQAGFSSDGQEVVALLAINYTSSTKPFRFTFAGSGLTGAFGETWEVVTLISAMQIWYTYNSAATKTTSTVVAAT